MDPVERVGDLVGDMALDVADEAQRHMVVFDVDPARSGQAAAQQGQRKGGVTRNFEGGEKTRHGELPSSNRTLPLANHRYSSGASGLLSQAAEHVSPTEAVV